MNLASRQGPMKLIWTRCACGHKSCTRQQPINLGFYYTGSGFEPAEVELMNEAFAALEEKLNKERQL